MMFENSLSSIFAPVIQKSVLKALEEVEKPMFEKESLESAIDELISS